MKSFFLELGICKKFPKSDLAIILLLTFSSIIYFFLTLLEFNKLFLVETAGNGGVIVEGTIEVPVYKNPLYAERQVERDISKLLHGGLLINVDGNLENNLAKEVLNEGDVYGITIKDEAIFHDGTPITSKDILNTIQMIVAIEGENHYKTMWDGIDIEVIDNKRFNIITDSHYFPEALTTPILPEHIWKKIPKEERKGYKGSGINIGAGPFKYKEETFTIDERTTSLTLSSFENYTLGKPYIEEIRFEFLLSLEDLLREYEKGNITSISGITPQELNSILNLNNDFNILISKTNRVFGAFFNTKEEKIFSDPFLRSIFAKIIEREKIVQNALNSQATMLGGPLSTEIYIQNTSTITEEELRQTLDDIGWEYNGATGQREKNGRELKIKILHPENTEFQKVAEEIAKSWRKLNVKVEITSKTGDYDALITGYRAKQPKDLINIWDEVEEVTGYENNKITNMFEDKENIVYNEIKKELEEDVPIIFLYSPNFIHLIPKDL